MTLKELSEQYYNAALVQSELIEQNRKRLAEAVRRYDCSEEYRLQKLLQLLYAQRRELIETAAQLKHYYKFSEDA